MAALSTLLLTAGLAVMPALLSTPAPAGATCSGVAGSFTITICGNQWVNQAGADVDLRGANTEGTQYDCAQSGAGFFDDTTVSVTGTTVNASTEITNLQKWGVNVVRVNLNEECWLGINGMPSTTSGTDTNGYDHYANVMGSYVAALNAAGIYTEVDLHLNAPGTEAITDSGNNDDQNALPESNSDTFWTSVGTYFNGNRAVIFGLFNEPMPVANGATNNGTDNGYNEDGDDATSWADTVGGTPASPTTNTQEDCTAETGSSTVTCKNTSGVTATYTAEGMAQMIHDVRAVDTTTPLLAGGPDFAGDMDDWYALYYPGGTSLDPDNLLAASVHIYYTGNASSSPCSASTSIASVCQTGAVGDTASTALVDTAAHVPVLIDELGNFTCSNTAALPALLSSIDTYNAGHGTDIGWVGWSWTTVGCDPTMISSFTTGAPSTMGASMYCDLYDAGMNNGTLTTCPTAPATPTVSNVTPNSGPTSGGTSITVTGTNFFPGTTVFVGQGAGPSGATIAATNVVVVNPTTITAVTGANALPGTFSTYVTTSAGTSPGVTADDFTYTAVAPTVTNVTPSSGTHNGGTAITVTGTGFFAGAVVEIGQGMGCCTGTIHATSVVVVSPTKITAVTGGGAITGTFSTYVVTSAGTSPGVLADDYTYN